MRLPFFVTLAVGVASWSARAVTSPVPIRITAADSSEAWFRFFRGEWRCSGGFPSGRKLEATVSFTSDLGGKWLQYRHTDVAPGSYRAGALWGHQARDSGIVSLLHDNSSVRAYRSEGWRDEALVFVKDTSMLRIPGAPVGAPDRFTYRRTSDSTYWFAWELPRPGGVWAIGDSLTCRRAG
ncbi:MAG: hypothetical protein V4558_04965 [Gemmatimonadota bacterium]